MFMYPFRKLSVHASRKCTFQFALAFQSASTGLESLPCGYGFGPHQS